MGHHPFLVPFFIVFSELHDFWTGFCLFYTRSTYNEISPKVFTNNISHNMNRTSTKRGFKALLAMFLLVGGMLFVSNSVNAQSVPSKLDVSGIMWVTESNALDILNQTIASTHQQMSGFTPGSNPFNAGMRRAVFLKSIHSQVDTGTGVQDAVSNTFGQYQNGSVAASVEAAPVFFSTANAQEEADFAIALLRVN